MVTAEARDWGWTLVTTSVEFELEHCNDAAELLLVSGVFLLDWTYAHFSERLGGLPAGEHRIAKN